LGGKDMKGICIEFKNANIKTIWPNEKEGIASNPIPKGKRAFEFLFNPILDRLETLSWLAHNFVSTPFVDLLYLEGGEEKLMAAEFDIFLADAKLFRPYTLPLLASYLYDDWINLIGFHQRDYILESLSKDCLERFNSRIRASYYDFIERQAQMCFFCVDGFSWEFYCRDYKPIELLFNRWASTDGLFIQHCTLGKQSL
jgi:hypothetical protein